MIRVINRIVAIAPNSWMGVRFKDPLFLFRDPLLIVRSLGFHQGLGANTHSAGKQKLCQYEPACGGSWHTQPSSHCPGPTASIFLHHWKKQSSCFCIETKDMNTDQGKVPSTTSSPSTWWCSEGHREAINPHAHSWTQTPRLTVVYVLIYTASKEELFALHPWRTELCSCWIGQSGDGNAHSVKTPSSPQKQPLPSTTIHSLTPWDAYF